MKKIIIIPIIIIISIISTVVIYALMSERINDIKMPIENKISETIPSIQNQADFGFVKSGVVDDMVSDINKKNISPADIQTVYHGKEIKQMLGIIGYGNLLNTSISPRSLYNINELYPIEYISRINDDTIYIVYKIYDRDNEISYLYLFFKKIDVKLESVDEQTETWWLKGKAFYVKKALQYNDFSNIKVGSSISEVSMVDPIVNSKVGIDGQFTDPFNSYHLLKDGVLRIQYAFDETASIYRVAVMEFVETFEIPIIENGNKSTICVKINGNDYPTQEETTLK